MASLAHKIFASLKAGGEAAVAASSVSDNKASGAPASASLSSSWNERFYHVAVQGCCHGELDRIYDACAEHEQQTGKRIGVLICCGDFQAVRTAPDMESMAVPDKFKVMGDFHKYWTASPSLSPQRTAPYLTIFVGGNHENSDLLAQESYGGFVAPNIYYLGHAGVVTVDHFLRIAGLSGIFKEPDYDRPYPSRPYAASSMGKKGAYHVRRIEVEKLHAYLRAAEALQGVSVATAGTKQASTSTASPLVDMFVSHDWPVGITSYGDEAQLLRIKPYFRDDIRRHALGNPHTMSLLREAKPLYWVAAHLHCLFEATVSHDQKGPSNQNASIGARPAVTKFVALDKCARSYGFLTFLDLPRQSASSPMMAGEAAHAKEKLATAIDNGDAQAGNVLGAARIRRDALWVEVLQASHHYAAVNRMASRDGSRAGIGERYAATGIHSLNGFDVDATVRELIEHHTGSDPHKRESVSETALQAPSTQALLAALRLPPALPLQMGNATAVRATPSSPPYAAHTHSSVEESVEHRQSRRSRTEVPPPPASVTAAGPLSFFEDVGNGNAPTAPAPVSPNKESASAPAPAEAPAPSPLGWFEDTAQ